MHGPQIPDPHKTQYPIVGFPILAFGFPLDIAPNTFFRPPDKFDNHTSASKYPNHIDHYLQTETGLGAIMGPFQNKPLPGLHCSQMMTRPKPTPIIAGS